MDLHEISLSLQKGKARETEELIEKAIREKHSIESILREGFVDAMMKTEQKFMMKEIFVSDVLPAARAMDRGIEIITPYLDGGDTSAWGPVITGTLIGDTLYIRKNLISILMQGMGLKVIDLGISVSSELFIDAVERENARMIVCSTCLTVHLPQMKALVLAAASANLRDKVKILFSGTPVTEQFCRSIGADMYAPDVVSAAELAAAYCKGL
jgi:methanogenic corrinoid protein MtbC1